MQKILSNINFLEFSNQLKAHLQNGSLDKNAHTQMMPGGRITVPDFDKPPRKSAVLILFYPDNNKVYFPLIRRPKYNGAHSGQMALPGGKYEKTDRNLIQTALRESCEEIGVCKTGIQVLGCLSELFIPITNMTVLPVIATSDYKPTFYTDQVEVEELFTISLNEFFDPLVKKKEVWDLRGNDVDIPFYLLQKQKVWGVTAMMLCELELLLNKILNK
ncbi:MAG: CoA pyrophosphatase [Salinivirgaceae bacterium]|nr:CoA pyrophosphatase [Salinivirgaceae bacterium]